MSASEFEVEAQITVCGIVSPLSLAVRYEYHEAEHGVRDIFGHLSSPEIPAGVTIISIWRISTEYMVPLAIFSDTQKAAIAAEILENV